MKYYSQKDFWGFTKATKLKLQQNWIKETLRVSKVLFIPIRKKQDGYGMSACFVETPKGWIRLRDYDCFRFDFFKKAPKQLKGDFEHGGVVFFTGDGYTIDDSNYIEFDGQMMM